jgi:hypothetical protein
MEPDSEPEDTRGLVTGQGGVQEQDSGKRKTVLERARNKGVHRQGSSGTRGNDCILDRRSKIQDVA